MILVVKRNFMLIFLIMLLMGYGIYNYFTTKTVSTFTLPTYQKTIFIDAGHGGFDPGKTGSDGIHEKDINLVISKKLQNYLEQSGAKVYVTRLEDEGLYLETDKNKKTVDMRKRVEMINESNADVLISVHQNSFTSRNTKGAQVFYFNNSHKSKLLAEKIQNQLVAFVEPENKRLAKANDNYYVLKKTAIPSVIVECGFLSNPEEEKKLNDEEYQQKIAWAIYMALIDYFSETEEN